MKNKSISSLFGLVAFLAILISSQNQLFAQIDVVHELNFSTAAKGVSSKTKSFKADHSRNEFDDLSQKLHSALYYENGLLINRYGNDAPVKVTLNDINSLAAISNKINPDFNNVKMITLALKNRADLNSKIDLTSLSGFPQLKYLFINCFFECSQSDIEESIVNSSNEIRVFFSYVMPN